MQRLRLSVIAALRPALTWQTAPALVNFPNYPNVGDSALYLGQLACLRALGVPAPRYVCDIQTYDRRTLSHRIGDGPILITGGGNFGDLWPAAQRLREEIIQSFPRNPIVQLPQSIFFQDSAAMRMTTDIINAHPSITLFARERQSFDIARAAFGDRVHLCSDTALCLGHLAKPAAAVHNVLWLRRTDKEASATSQSPTFHPQIDWLEEPATLLRSLNNRLTAALRGRYPARLIQPLVERTYEPLARKRLRRGMKLLSSARVVITDRLHGHILCLLAGIPHVLLDNSYGKVGSFYRTWTSDVEGVYWADSEASALEIAEGIASNAA